MQVPVSTAVCFLSSNSFNNNIIFTPDIQALSFLS